MDVLLSHIWYIIATFLLGTFVGFKFKAKIEGYTYQLYNYILEKFSK